jgi:hypothetical protein
MSIKILNFLNLRERIDPGGSIIYRLASRSWEELGGSWRILEDLGGTGQIWADLGGS